MHGMGGGDGKHRIKGPRPKNIKGILYISRGNFNRSWKFKVDPKNIWSQHFDCLIHCYLQMKRNCISSFTGGHLGTGSLSAGIILLGRIWQKGFVQAGESHSFVNQSAGILWLWDWMRSCHHYRNGSSFVHFRILWIWNKTKNCR